MIDRKKASNYISPHVFDGVRPLSKSRVAKLRTSFFASLTDDQKKAALEYDGDETHGDSEFLRK